MRSKWEGGLVVQSLIKSAWMMMLCAGCMRHGPPRLLTFYYRPGQGHKISSYKCTSFTYFLQHQRTNESQCLTMVVHIFNRIMFYYYYYVLVDCKCTSHCWNLMDTFDWMRVVEGLINGPHVLYQHRSGRIASSVILLNKWRWNAHHLCCWRRNVDLWFCQVYSTQFCLLDVICVHVACGMTQRGIVG